MPALMRGELATLRRWLTVVPEDTVRDSARLCVLHAWVLLLTGQIQAIEPRLRQAERSLTADEDHLRGDMTAIRAYVAAQRGDVARTIDLADKAVRLLDETKLGELGVVYFVLGGAHLLRGDVAAAAQALAKASVVGRQGGNVHVAVPALNALAGLHDQQGRLFQAQATAQEAIGLATGHSGRPLPFAGGAVSALAEVAYEWNDLENALAYAQQSVDLSQRWGNRDSLSSGYLTLAQVLLARGDLVGAGDALQEAVRMSQEYTLTPMFSIQLRTGRARLWLAQGGRKV
jgi:LuxR family maltose regulon positive regulatory protein